MIDDNEYVEKLETIASAVFGSNWIYDLTKLTIEKGLDKNAVAGWLSGEREIPVNVLRGLMSLAYDKAELIKRTAEKLSQELRYEDGYEKIILVHGMNIPDLRIDLDSKNRTWFDIDGRLVSIDEDDNLIDIRGWDVSAEITSDVKTILQSQIVKRD